MKTPFVTKEQLEASTGYMFGAEKAVRFDVKVKRG